MFTHCKTMLACAPNALWAMKHGLYAGRNIANTIKQKPLHAFTYKGLGTGVQAWVLEKEWENYTGLNLPAG
jgi:NADH dehydrogenase